jgi:hypothetical protein
MEKEMKKEMQREPDRGIEKEIREIRDMENKSKRKKE